MYGPIFQGDKLHVRRKVICMHSFHGTTGVCWFSKSMALNKSYRNTAPNPNCSPRISLP